MIEDVEYKLMKEVTRITIDFNYRDFKNQTVIFDIDDKNFILKRKSFTKIPFITFIYFAYLPSVYDCWFTEAVSNSSKCYYKLVFDDGNKKVFNLFDTDSLYPISKLVIENDFILTPFKFPLKSTSDIINIEFELYDGDLVVDECNLIKLLDISYKKLLTYVGSDEND